MRLPHSVPCPNGTDRARRAKFLRDLCTDISRTRPHAETKANGEEADFAAARFPSNFTKGLLHDELGVLAKAGDYAAFVEAINSENNNLFVSGAFALNSSGFRCTIGKPKETPKWRGWESPRAGHVYELEGPDPGSVGMAPAPRVGSSELTAEMAELYALALLRDVRFTDICDGSPKSTLCGEEEGTALLSSGEIAELLSGMPFYSRDCAQSSTPLNAADGLNAFESRRRLARLQGQSLTPKSMFRGSTRGAFAGPYISQFLLIGTDAPMGSTGYKLADGRIGYGTLTIDQRTLSHKNCLDHMTDWYSWLDVQNGADFRGLDLWEPKTRFITTPRDLATYVHRDQLYEAYLNAVLILLGMSVPTSKGFPEPSMGGGRTGFATFGGPHILSLVTEVATRCLKAVRRQKFCFHRRARPEVMGGRLTLAACGKMDALGCAAGAFERTLTHIPNGLRDAVAEHNNAQNAAAMASMRMVRCEGNKGGFAPSPDCNLLLPMAFPEGSPMHPAYGAGHATVAGGCVTMIKAFFEMFEDCDAGVERPLRHGSGPAVYVPDALGQNLIPDPQHEGPLTIQGELDKLAANIAIGRNMAGVHYYSDYYDSLRMGERVAVGILLEQAPTYGDLVETTFTSFDGDRITVAGQANAAPSLTVIDRSGNEVAPREWWLRHVPGEQIILDL